MSYGKVRQFDLNPHNLFKTRKFRVYVYEEPMFPDSFLQKDGSFPCCISPDEYREDTEHYWFETYEDPEGQKQISLYCDLFYVDEEYDGFFVQVQHWYDDQIQVRMHSTHDTWFNPSLMRRIAQKVSHVEMVLPFLSVALENRLDFEKEKIKC